MRNSSAKNITILLFCLALVGALAGGCLVVFFYGEGESAEPVVPVVTETKVASAQESAEPEKKIATSREQGFVRGADPYEALEKRVNNLKGGVKYDGFLVSLKPEATREQVSAIDKAIAAGAHLNKLKYSGNTYTAESVEDVRKTIDQDLIERIEPDFLVSMAEDSASPNDPYYSEQANLRSLNVPTVWEDGLEGQDLDGSVDMNGDGKSEDDDIIVAVIDSGLDSKHEDIDAERIVRGKSFAEGVKPDDTGDSEGHGTMVAGIIAARKNNNMGVAGVLQKVKIMPLRVFGAENQTEDSIVIEAINYAASLRENYNKGKGGANISVVNLSLSGEDTTEPEKQACERAIAAGIIVISSAGNGFSSSGQKASFPAQYTLGVGSVGNTGNISSFSQRISEKDGTGYVNKVWVCAPGEKIYGTISGANAANINSNYTMKSGTSFSCPQVSALAAICKGIDNGMDHQTFRQLLKDTAVAADSGEGHVRVDGQETGQDVAYGWGRVDFVRTIQKLAEEKYSGSQSQSVVRFRVRNALDEEIEGATVQVWELSEGAGQGTEVEPEKDGSWKLVQGKSYQYRISADGYNTFEGRLLSIALEKTVSVKLTGAKKYRVVFQMVDENGEPTDDFNVIKVYEASMNTLVKQNKTGVFELPIGNYFFGVDSDSSIVRGDNLFTVDPRTLDPAEGLVVSVTLVRSRIRLVWGDEPSEQVEIPLVSMLRYQTEGRLTMRMEEGWTLTCGVDGITMKDLLQNFCKGLTKDKKAVWMEVSGEWEGQESTVSLSEKEIDSAMIALIVDPETGTSEGLISEGNCMRLAMDYRARSEWLYNLSEIRVSLEDVKETPQPAPSKPTPATKKTTEVRDLPALQMKKIRKHKKYSLVKWKKLSKKARKRVGGIELQYSSTAKFKALSTTTKKLGKGRSSWKVKQPAKGKKLYVRVRTYRKSGNVLHISKWSIVKKVG